MPGAKPWASMLVHAWNCACHAMALAGSFKIVTCVHCFKQEGLIGVCSSVSSREHFSLVVFSGAEGFENRWACVGVESGVTAGGCTACTPCCGSCLYIL